MVTIPDLPLQATGDVSDDDLILIYDMGGGLNPSRKVTRASLLTGVVRTAGYATLNTVDANALNAPVGAIDALTVATSIQIGATLGRLIYAAPSLAIPTCAAGTEVTVTSTLAGVVAGDMILITAEGLAPGLILRAQVTGANTVTVYAFNASGASITGASRTVRVLALRMST
ncbi:MAG: hypothetical protein ACRC14_01825 [Paracoccaceae bacterium]